MSNFTKNEKKYADLVESLIEEARKEEIVIEAVLSGNRYTMYPIVNVREMTAQEKLDTIMKQRKKKNASTKKKKKSK